MKNQKGSTLVVAVILLTVAVLGLLSFVFWQNFLAPKDTQVSTTSPTSQLAQSDLSETKVIDYSGATFSFSYPKSWTIAEKNSTDGTLTSPDKSIYYDYSVLSLGGIGGTCGDSENDTLTSIAWEKSAINNDIVFGQYSRKSAFDGTTNYLYGFGLMSDTDDLFRNAKVGDTGCVIDIGREYIKTTLKNSDGEPVVAVLNGHFTLVKDSIAMSKAEIKQGFTGETFKVAKKIALSATLKY